MERAVSSRRVPRWAGWALSAVLLAAVALALRGRWEAVGEAGGLPGLGPSTLAVLAYVVANLVLALAWRDVVRAAGAVIGVRDALWVWAASQLARYTVGAAQIGGRAVLGRRYGLTLTTGAVTALVEVGWQSSLTAALALGTFPWWLPGAEDLTWLAWSGALPAGILLVGLVRPRALLRWLAALLGWGPVRRMTGGRLDAVADRVALGRLDALRITGRYALNSGLRLVGFLLIFAAVGGDLGRDGLRAVGAYAVGQLVGRLAVFAPGGLGPREGATALVIAPALGGGPALVLVAATRLLEVVGELVFLGLARLGLASLDRGTAPDPAARDSAARDGGGRDAEARERGADG